MRVDIHTVPEVVTLRSDEGTVLYSAATLLALKRAVRLDLESGANAFGMIAIVDEHGNAVTLKEWART